MLTLPFALGPTLVTMLAQRARFSLRLLAGCGVLAAGLAATAGAIHANASAPRNYDVVTAGIVGTAMGLAPRCRASSPDRRHRRRHRRCRRRLVISGLGFAQFETEYLLFSVVVFLILAIPLCLLIALLPGRSP